VGTPYQREKTVQLIVIVGAPRSGTSLLQNLITVAPNIASAPETHFFAHATRSLLYERGLPPIGKEYPRDTIDYDRATRLMARLTNAMNLDRPVRDWLPASPGNAPISLRTLAKDFFEHLANGAPYFLEKSPPHAFFLPEILHLFPDAKIINIVRDPRDVIASINGMLQKQGKDPRSIFERTRTWNASVSCAFRHSLFTVKYEDLVLNPSAVMHRVLEHLRMTYDTKSPEKTENAATLTTRKRETWKANNFSAVSGAMIGKYRNTLSEKDIREVEMLCSHHMQTLGYEKSQPRRRTNLPIIDMCRYYAMRTQRTGNELLARVTHS
jgi:hypothetical protein